MDVFIRTYIKGIKVPTKYMQITFMFVVVFICSTPFLNKEQQ